METITNYLKGKRTYVSVVVLVLVAIQAVIPEITFIPQDVVTILIPVLGGLVAYFRSLA
jgi:hypothetical protein